MFAYKSLIYFVFILVFTTPYLAHTGLVVEELDNESETSIQSTPDNDNVNEVEVDTEIQEEKTDIEIDVNNEFEMSDNNFEITGFLGFADINNRKNFGLQWNLAGDILFRVQQYDRWVSSLGLRYRFAFDYSDNNPEIKFHQLTFLIQTLIFIKNKLFKLRGFIGPVLGIHIWKSLRLDYDDNEYRKSSEFFWNKFSYQIGIKSGTLLSSHFAFTTEVGFDQLVFRRYEEKRGDKIVKGNSRLLFNNVYLTLGISCFF